MIDYHVHIGQFNEAYYDALEVFDTIESTASKTGITEIRYSTTSSCRDDAELSGVEEEIAYAENLSSSVLSIKPYLWFIPKYINQKISFESAVSKFDYCGIKLHPFAQEWDFDNLLHIHAMHEIFDWADRNNKSVLIHCGLQKCTSPERFRTFYSEYKNAQVILAHSNPTRETAFFVNNYKNVFCDIAASTKEHVFDICSLVNDRKKVLFGSDFPVTHYFNDRLFDKHFTLKEQYLTDCKSILFLNGGNT